LAVYTQLSSEQLRAILALYDIGELVSAKGIAEGVSNSNWLIETRQGAMNRRYILTMYERRIEIADLPFFLGLLDHLAQRGCPVPRTIHLADGRLHANVDGKAVALIEYLPGITVDSPSPAQARSVGRALAQIHLAARDYPARREQTLGLKSWRAAIDQIGADALESFEPGLAKELAEEIDFLSAHWPADLASGVSHCDLFPDNVLMLGDRVSGLIDFYFAANDFFAYDLAVTHAAWCFDPTGAQFHPEIGAQLIAGYEDQRPLRADERAALGVLARGAAMRFIVSRVQDWIDTDDRALVHRKDPVEFLRRLRFYREAGATAFAEAKGGD